MFLCYCLFILPFHLEFLDSTKIKLRINSNTTIQLKTEKSLTSYQIFTKGLNFYLNSKLAKNNTLLII